LRGMVWAEPEGRLGCRSMHAQYTEGSPPFDGRSFQPDVATLQVHRLVLEHRHGRGHALEAQALVKAFLARHAIQDDLLVISALRHQPLDDGFAEALALVLRQQGHITQVSAIAAIGQGTACADQAALTIAHEPAEHAVAEGRLQSGRLLFGQGRTLVQIGQFLPIHVVDGFAPLVCHAASLLLRLNAIR